MEGIQIFGKQTIARNKMQKTNMKKQYVYENKEAKTKGKRKGREKVLALFPHSGKEVLREMKNRIKREKELQRTRKRQRES